MRFNPIKDIRCIVFNGKLSQHRFIFFTEGLAVVVFLLIADVFDDGVNFRMRIAKCSISLLPAELTPQPNLVINEVSGVPLDVSYQI